MNGRRIALVVFLLVSALMLTGCFSRIENIIQQFAIQGIRLMIFVAGVLTAVVVTYQGVTTIAQSALNNSQAIARLIMSIGIAIVGLAVAIIGPSVIPDVAREISTGSGNIQFYNPMKP
ncbi:MAG: hypothetical protein NZM04_09615 [Methylacidiphilales bacterium]|nr:hypothetical protein [Candidatus Methylacidiphilales bacterium]